MTPNSTAERLFSEAASHFRRGDRAVAYRLLAEAIEADPTHAEANLELARLYIAAGRNEDAETLLRRALAASPEHPGLATNFGILLCLRQSYADGLRWLEQAVNLAPQDARAHFNHANGLKAAGQLEAAITSYRRALACDPGFAPAYRNLGNCLIDSGAVLEAAAAYDAGTRLRRGPSAPLDDSFTRTSEGKLRHDIEQLEYLTRQGAIGAEGGSLATDYREAAALLSPPAAGTHIVELPLASQRKLMGTYNRLWHYVEAPVLPNGAVNSRLDRKAIEADYAQRAPGITFVDNFLTPDALHALRRFCLESTIWFSFRYANGYLGAFWEEGFSCPLLLQIAEELRQALPAIFRDHRLRKMWAFKYDSRLSGIPIHADFAAVNVNFWITPDSANLAPDHGGLIVWDKEAPADWDFKSYNADEASIRAFLAASQAKSVAVPHRQNRAVIFNSDLFHETDRIAFADGYENRRINVTLLFGKRHG